jgi:LuxR family maltose regulon positive regulatory protein
MEAAHKLLRQANAIREDLTFRQANISAHPSLEQLSILLSRAAPEMSHLQQAAVRQMESLGLDFDARQAHELDFAEPEGYAREADYADLARVLVASGRASEALPLIERLVKAAGSMGRQGDAIRYLALQSVALREEGDRISALASLEKALTLAEPEGYVRIFLDEGEAMAGLLREAGLRGIAPDYVTRLLAAFGMSMKDEEPALSAPSEAEGSPLKGQGLSDERLPSTVRLPYSLIDPLSERELEVLRLMAAGLKHREIAEELVISLNTVRHHARNIYGKLDVHSRAKAVAKARELDLL